VKVDLAKRRRVMQRSMKLGHCVCDPRRPCPCDVFTNQGICPCAGERPDPIDLSQVRLTQMVHNAGCASKIAPADLEAVLARLPRVDDPAVLSGVAAGDDAGIYQLSEDVTLVQTVDVFTPCVDDPYTFGRICAANCLSDIYAMGAVPRTALSILGFPSETHDGRIMYHMLKGAMDVMAEAKVALIGGHSIKDEEIKLGFAITGTIERGRAVEHGTARPGDVLVLTKPLGVGVLNFARQVGKDGADFAAAEQSMATLNAAAAEAMAEVGVSACTDVTGFGLFGHLISMVRHSGMTARVYADSLPAFGGAVELLRGGVVPGAVERNREYVGADLAVAEGVDAALADLGFDAQTSGGLLICVPRERHGRLMAVLAQRGVRGRTIGEIVEPSTGRIELCNAGEARPATETRDAAEAAPGRPAEVEAPAAPADGDVECECMRRIPPALQSPPLQAELRVADAGASPCCGPSAAAEPCCPQQGAAAAPAATAAPGESTAALSSQAFGQMMRVTGRGGAIDERSKFLINFALAVMSRCAPCVAAFVEKARNQNVPREQLDEAAWCAIAMGGAPVRMFYQDAMENVGRGRGCCT